MGRSSGVISVSRITFCRDATIGLDFAGSLKPPVARICRFLHQSVFRLQDANDYCQPKLTNALVLSQRRVVIHCDRKTASIGNGKGDVRSLS